MLALVGCPRELEAPEAMGELACESHEDCNAGPMCGEISLCVGGFCELETSLTIPCPGEGVLVP